MSELAAREHELIQGHELHVPWELGKDERWPGVAPQPLTSVTAERVAVRSAPAGTARGCGLRHLPVRLPVRNPVDGPATQRGG